MNDTIREEPQAPMVKVAIPDDQVRLDFVIQIDSTCLEIASNIRRIALESLGNGLFMNEESRVCLERTVNLKLRHMVHTREIYYDCYNRQWLLSNSCK